MQGRWFNTAVVMLWLVTMSWLVTEKVLPPLLVGEPPSYSRIVEAQRDVPPVGWRMLFNDRPLGWALSDTRLQPNGLTEIHGRVHFDALPLGELLPNWLRALSRLAERPIDRLQMDARSTLTIGPLGHLVRFDSKVQVDPFDEAICVHGTVEGRLLQLEVRNSNGPFSNAIVLPADALLCDALSPQTQLPGLRTGQKWTVPVYSPLWSAKTPLEIVHAEVKGTEPMLWSGVVEDCQLVEYRSDSVSEAGGNQKLRGKLWVRRDGTVLRQQVFLLDAAITFDRVGDDEAVKLVAGGGPAMVEHGERPAGRAS